MKKVLILMLSLLCIGTLLPQNQILFESDYVTTQGMVFKKEDALINRPKGLSLEEVLRLKFTDTTAIQRTFSKGITTGPTWMHRTFVWLVPYKKVATHEFSYKDGKIVDTILSTENKPREGLQWFTIICFCLLNIMIFNILRIEIFSLGAEIIGYAGFGIIVLIVLIITAAVIANGADLWLSVIISFLLTEIVFIIGTALTMAWIESLLNPDEKQDS